MHLMVCDIQQPKIDGNMFTEYEVSQSDIVVVAAIFNSLHITTYSSSAANDLMTIHSAYSCLGKPYAEEHKSLEMMGIKFESADYTALHEATVCKC